MKTVYCALLEQLEWSLGSYGYRLCEYDLVQLVDAVLSDSELKRELLDIARKANDDKPLTPKGF